MLQEIEMYIRFDREIDPDVHYILPGGYEMVFRGKSIRFDFENAICSLDRSDRTVLDCCIWSLDTSAFPEAEGIEITDKNDLNEIRELYVYTGEHDDPAIKPVKLLSLIFETDDKIVDGSDTDAVKNFTFEQ